MISVMLVEDELNILRYMQKALERHEAVQVTGIFSNPSEALSAFAGINPDCVFLDIEMPKMNGIDLAREILKIKKDTHIVYTTAFSEYAVQAFGVEAIDYLMKPISFNDISRSIKRVEKALAYQSLSNKKTDLIVPVKCFGTFDVRDSKGELVKWPTKKAEEVFAYFVCHQGEGINKWRLIDLFWSDLNEEKGLNNLYNTIYRIKNVLTQLDHSPQIKKVNDDYILVAQKPLSDFKYLIELTEMKLNEEYIQKSSSFMLKYNSPMFGLKDYMWHYSIEENANRLLSKICSQLINYYRDSNDFPAADQLIRHYVLQHLEDESLMRNLLEIVSSWKGKQKETEYRNWFNKLLITVDLPIL